MKSATFLKAVLIVGALSAVLVVLIKNAADRTPIGGLSTGNAMPALEAEGWLNGDGPGELDGKVVVIHGWFTTCKYCLTETPELAEVVDEYSGDGVQFVSLTFDDQDDMPAIEKFMDDTGMTWLTGYGAKPTLRALKAEQYPCMWVVDRSGEIIWNRDSDESLRDAIDQALKSAPSGA